MTVQKIKSMLDGLEPDDSIMVIHIKEHSEDELEATSAAILNSSHLTTVRDAFDKAFERSFLELADESPLTAMKTLMEMMARQKD